MTTPHGHHADRGRFAMPSRGRWIAAAVLLAAIVIVVVLLVVYSGGGGY